MSAKELPDELFSALKANAPIVQMISYETLRVHAKVNLAAGRMKFQWYSWNRIEGLRRWDTQKRTLVEEKSDLDGPSEILEYYLNDEDGLPANSILLLEDFHPDLTEGDPRIVRLLRNIALRAPKQKRLVLTQPFNQLPRELEKEVQIIDLPLADLQDLANISRQVCAEFRVDEGADKTQLLEAALGMTIMEAKIAFSKAAAEKGALSDDQISYVIKEKEQILRKTGYLEYFHPDRSLDQIGGLDNLKGWLKKRGRGFTPEAREYGLDTPRGVLLLGLPGTGKSLTAKAIAMTWGYPLLKLDMGKIFGGIVGQSESNMRNSLQVAEAMAPCVLWLDEIEKGMAGIESSGSTDGGTTSRVLGTFLTWMQEKSRPVFIVATANNIGQLPPELLRKGRMDEIFFVDLPSSCARREILEIHLKNKKRLPDNFDLNALAEASIGFSGAELEEAIKEALFQAFDEGKTVETAHILQAIQRTTPLSRTRAEEIRKMRQWAKTRAVSASSDPAEELPAPKDEAPKLKSETYQNPFI
jgi:hypothetical protein